MADPLTLHHSGPPLGRDKGNVGALWLSFIVFPFYSTWALAHGMVLPTFGVGLSLSRNPF